jgi:GNAT superfamily N-acetyltransferase
MDRIIQLHEESIPQIMQLISDAVEAMNSADIQQWDEIYPDQRTVERDISEGTLYGLWIENTLACIITINEFQDKEYAEINWEINDLKPLVVHRLCVSPVFQGRGFAKLMMQFAENHAKKNDYKSIRLDAFTRNPASVGLYRDLGYRERGIVTFRKGDFYCFEKVF